MSDVGCRNARFGTEDPLISNLTSRISEASRFSLALNDHEGDVVGGLRAL